MVGLVVVDQKQVLVELQMIRMEVVVMQVEMVRAMEQAQAVVAQEALENRRLALLLPVLAVILCRAI